MSRGVSKGRARGAGVTHQEFPQVLVVGDDAVVDDDELWRQRTAPLSPRPRGTDGTSRVTTALGRTERRASSPRRDPPALPHLAWPVTGNGRR